MPYLQTNTNKVNLIFFFPPGSVLLKSSESMCRGRRDKDTACKSCTSATALLVINSLPESTWEPYFYRLFVTVYTRVPTTT